MKKVINKKLAIACFVAAVMLVLGVSMAYFTDYAATSAEGTAGTVAIALDSKINLLNEDGMDILNPGDMRDAGFDVTNMGNKSIDVRETISLKVLDREGNAISFTGDADTQSEFDLYYRSDVSEVPGEGYKPNAGAKPLQIKSVNGNVITYTTPEYSLNGNSDEYDEVETIDGVDTFVKENDFVLVFKGEAGNDWQDVSLEMDVIVEAKQHENTGAGWEIVAQKEVTQGPITKDVVEEEIIITPLETVPVVPEEPIIIRFFWEDYLCDENGDYIYDEDGNQIPAIVPYKNVEVGLFPENAGGYSDSTPLFVGETNDNGEWITSTSEIPNGIYEAAPVLQDLIFGCQIGIIDENGDYVEDVHSLEITGPGTYNVVIYEGME